VAVAIQPLAPEVLNKASSAYAAVQSRRRLHLLIGIMVFLGCTIAATRMAEIDLAKFATNAHRFSSYIARIFVLDNGQSVLTDMSEWFWGFKKWLKLIGETLVIAYVGTALGGMFAFLLCFLASNNLYISPWIQFITRRGLEFARTVPTIVFALTFVVAFGLGALPGVLAIAIHTAGALGKQFFEVIENIDSKPIEGVMATGASWSEMVRFAVMPQVSSSLVGYGLLRFEINVREAAVMGFVGAGGIGQVLLEAIRKFYYSDVSAILVLVIATVMVIDVVTGRIRHALIGQEARS
jgi:phosphonate transport system permease protein